MRVGLIGPIRSPDRYAKYPPLPTYSQNRRGIKTRGGSFEFGLNFKTKKVSSFSLAYDFSQGKNFRELFFFAVFTGNIPSAYFIATFE